MTNKKIDFVDELMNKAFDLDAPEMPDFAEIKEDNAVTELSFEQLDYLNAAGVAEIQIGKKFQEVKKNNDH